MATSVTVFPSKLHTHTCTMFQAPVGHPYSLLHTCIADGSPIITRNLPSLWLLQQVIVYAGFEAKHGGICLLALALSFLSFGLW